MGIHKIRMKLLKALFYRDLAVNRAMNTKGKGSMYRFSRQCKHHRIFTTDFTTNQIRIC